jgi:bisphosphoglycerate-dependent phosphoglycerate mutase
MIPLLRNELQTFFGWIAVMLAQTKGHNRAVHPGEKPDKEREGIKVVCADLQTISTVICSMGLVNPHIIQMQLNQ